MLLEWSAGLLEEESGLARERRPWWLKTREAVTGGRDKHALVVRFEDVVRRFERKCGKRVRVELARLVVCGRRRLCEFPSPATTVMTTATRNKPLRFD